MSGQRDNTELTWAQNLSHLVEVCQVLDSNNFFEGLGPLVSLELRVEVQNTDLSFSKEDFDHPELSIPVV